MFALCTRMVRVCVYVCVCMCVCVVCVRVRGVCVWCVCVYVVCVHVRVRGEGGYVCVCVCVHAPPARMHVCSPVEWYACRNNYVSVVIARRCAPSTLATLLGDFSLSMQLYIRKPCGVALLS